jgi:hypothetical protein
MEMTRTLRDAVADLDRRIAELISLPRPKKAERTELEIRLAMRRIINKQPQRTDGGTSISSLAAEAGVDRVTIHRGYPKAKADWDEIVELRGGATFGGLAETVKDLRAEIAKLRQEETAEKKRLREWNAVLVQQVQALTLLLEAYQQGQAASGNVFSLAARKAQEEGRT